MNEKPIHVADLLMDENRKVIWYLPTRKTIPRVVYLIVEYSREHWTKSAAWNHLQKNTPSDAKEQLKKLKDLFDVPGLQNPWREDHYRDVFRWKMEFKSDQELHELAQKVNSQEIRTFDPQVWRSTSNKYRHVARLPEGMTAMQAMEKYFPERYQGYFTHLEQRARRDFLRMYSDKVEGCKAELTEAEWIRFKKEGGQLG